MVDAPYPGIKEGRDAPSDDDLPKEFYNMLVSAFADGMIRYSSEKAVDDYIQLTKKILLWGILIGLFGGLFANILWELILRFNPDDEIIVALAMIIIGGLTGILIGVYSKKNRKIMIDRMIREVSKRDKEKIVNSIGENFGDDLRKNIQSIVRK